MTYTLDYSEKARKQIKKLEKAHQERIISTLERCVINPWRHAEKVLGSTYYRFRAGDYRIVVDIQDDKLIVLVIEVAHRSTVYRFYEEQAKYRAESRQRIMRRAMG